MTSPFTRVVVGVDVGGTNTDAVLLSSDISAPVQILSFAKIPTTDDITTGVKCAIAEAVNSALPNYDVGVTQINIGTTHFINAIVQRKNLVKVAVIRLCGSASLDVPPFIDVPEDLLFHINGGAYFVNGGYEFDGREISPVKETEIIQCLDKIEADGIKNVVVSGVFSPHQNNQENLVREIIKQKSPNISVTVASELGQIGLLERENAAILNECLTPLSNKTIDGFRRALSDLRLNCPFYLTQNDGTIVKEDTARKFPVCTFSSGPTNSMRGAAFLSNIKNAIVVDIGGTTTDVGFLEKGFPREASSEMKVGGMRTNFRMPDVLSIGLGGGSYVYIEKPNAVRVGPLSAGYNIMNESLVFSDKGNTENRRLTATDIAVAANLCRLGHKENVQHLSEAIVHKTVAEIKQMIEKSIDQMKVSAEDVPLILVGGGSILVEKSNGLKGISEILTPQYADVANAIGAALSQVSGTVEYVVNLIDNVDEEAMLADTEKELNQVQNVSPEESDAIKQKVKKKYLERAHVSAMDEACNLAISKTVAAGADFKSVTIIEKLDTPLAYLPGNATKVRVKAVGDLKSSHEATNKILQELNKTEDGATKGSVNRNLEKQKFTVRGELLTKRDNIETKVPYIDKISGEWILSTFDIDCISIGSGILGCGGGGSPYIGKLRAHKALKEGKVMKVVDPKKFLTGANRQNDLTLAVAYMGAPLVLTEKMNHAETKGAFRCMQDLYNYGKYNDGVIDMEDGSQIKAEAELSFIDDYNPHKNYASEEDVSGIGEKHIVALMSAEIGGMNGIEPLLLSADLEIPVVDCDGMGRAFPELQMYVPLIYGVNPYPSTLADNKGRRAVVLKTDSAKHLENHFRNVVVEMGCTAGLVISSLTNEDVLHKTVLYSLSKAWRIGQSVISAREASKPSSDAILETVGGNKLISGKITNVKRETTGGFNKGYLMVEGTDTYSGLALKIEFQNENLVVQKIDESKQGLSVVACVPDLIVLIDTDTGESIPTESVRYGLRVSVLVLPAPDILQTDQALRFVGPQAFGLEQNVKYKPCGTHKDIITVFDQFG